jgi:hypothetical protein
LVPKEFAKMQISNLVQPSTGQDPTSAEQRLDRYLFLRHQVLVEIEKRIHNMMDRIGDELFQPQIPPQG